MGGFELAVMVSLTFCGTVALIFALYLLYSKKTFFVTDITPSRRIRRYTGNLLLILSLIFFSGLSYHGHFNTDEVKDIYGTLLWTQLDFFILIPSISCWMFAFLQDGKKYTRMILPTLIIPVICFFAHLTTKNPIFAYCALSFWILFIICFGTYFIIRLLKYRRAIRNYFSDLEGKRFRWILRILIFSIISALTYLILLSKENLSECYWIFVLHLSDLCIMILMLWIADHQSLVSEINIEEEEEEEEENKIVMSAGDEIGEANTEVVIRKKLDEMIADKLEKICIGKKLYLKPNLNSLTLAHELGTNRTYISKYLNAHGTNFNRYINELRIQYAMKLIKESGRKVNWAQIAKKCGFHQLNSFRTAFKKYTGVLPSEYDK